MTHVADAPCNPAFSFAASRGLSHEARKAGVQSFLKLFAAGSPVQFSFEKTPCTNGKTVWLGDLNPLDPAFEILAIGHGIHEMMHVTDTDMGEVEKLSDDTLAETILNVLEDVRIDRLGAQRHRTYRMWRCELIRVLDARGCLRASQCPGSLNCAELFTAWLHTALMDEAGYAWAAARRPNLEAELGKMLPARILSDLLKAACGIFKAQNTAAAVRIAKRIVRLLLVFRSECEARIAADKAPRSVLSKDASCDSDPSPLASLGFLDEANVTAQTNSNARRRRTKAARRSKQTAPLRSEMKLWDYWPDGSDNPMISADREEYGKAFAEVAHLVPDVAGRITELLKTPDEAPLGSATEGAVFARDWVQTVMSSDERLFECPVEAHSVNAEVCVLLDRSGSMGVATMSAAKAAVVGLLSSLKQISGVSARAACFPGPIDSRVSITASVSEPIESIADRFAGIGAYGSTPIDEALLWAQESFRNSQSKDRLLLLITDGVFEPQACSRAEEKLSAIGVELAVMSIYAPNAEICRNACVMEDLGELPELLATLFSRTTFCATVRG